MKKHRVVPKQFGVISAAILAVVLGATSADAGLKVYDHRAASLYPISAYFSFDQTLAVLNVKTGDFQYTVDNAGIVSRYDQDGFVDNNPIPAADLTVDTVWFSHRDVNWNMGGGPGAADVVTFETPTGGAGGTLTPRPLQSVFTPSGGVANDWYDVKQGAYALPLPVDGPAIHQIDGSLNFNDASPTGYTGAVTHGFGGLGHGSGTTFGSESLEDGTSMTLGFKLEEADGTHYGWVAIRHNYDRNRIWIKGWAYQTTPLTPAEMTWIGDPSGPGDFDVDGDVDADDIDILCANMGGDPATYDMDGDLDVDEDDMIYHIVNLVEWDNGVDTGVGTMQGDFNLDGVVNATDLAIMAGTFGDSGVDYADGNANCDDVVNATDLAILKNSFGFIAPTGGGVPEPATLSLLAMGAAGLAAKRRRKS